MEINKIYVRTWHQEIFQQQQKYDEEILSSSAAFKLAAENRQNCFRKHISLGMKRDYNVCGKAQCKKEEKSHKNPSNKNDGSINCNRWNYETNKSL